MQKGAVACGHDRGDLRAGVEALGLAEPESGPKEMGEVRPALVRRDLEGEAARNDAAQPVPGRPDPVHGVTAFGRAHLAAREQQLGEARRRSAQPAPAPEEGPRLVDPCAPHSRFPPRLSAGDSLA
jgi:hypothetical protein